MHSKMPIAASFQAWIKSKEYEWKLIASHVQKPGDFCGPFFFGGRKAVGCETG